MLRVMLKTTTRPAFPLALPLALALTAAAPAGAEPLPVAVTVPPQAWLVERIAGDRAEVTVVLPPGASHETYEPTPRQVLAVRRARLWVKVGHPDLLLERRLAGLVGGEAAIPVVSMAEGVSFLPSPDPHHGESDPHLWLSPPAFRATAERVAAALARLDPAGRPAFSANLTAVLAELDALDRRLAALLAPVRGRAFLVHHPAWGYFADRYGLRQLAIESEGKEPGIAGLAEVIELARRERIRAVFVQKGFNEAPAQVVAQEIGAEVVTLDPIARDWPATLEATARAILEALTP
jgi:zinc transport system substrate-binding protein